MITKHEWEFRQSQWDAFSQVGSLARARPLSGGGNSRRFGCHSGLASRGCPDPGLGFSQDRHPPHACDSRPSRPASM